MSLPFSFTVIFLGWLILSAVMIFMWMVLRQRMDREAQSASYATWGGSISKANEALKHPALRIDTSARTDHRPVDEEAADETDTNAETEPESLAAPHPATLVRSLDDMLDGIELPYDLTPIHCLVENPERHLVFLSTHQDARDIGTRFADEVIRLGYEFQPVGLDQAIAIRGEDVISMTVTGEANEVEDGDRLRYWPAGDGDVALELWVGRSTSPPATVGSN